MKKRSRYVLVLFSLVLLTSLFLNINSISAASFTVVPETSCQGGSQVALRLSGTTNAHGALKSQSNFPGNNVLCADFGSGSTSCTGTNKYLKISSAGNAHGERLDFSNYDTDACYSVKECRTITSGNCNSGQGEFEAIRLSSATNAHIGASTSGYTNKICCKVEQAEDPGIMLTIPNGGQTWGVGSTQPIEWSSSPVGAISNVKIEIDREGFGEWETLFSSITNDGVEGWVVTSPATTSAKIRVSDASNAAINDVSDAVFTITGGEEVDPSVPEGGSCTETSECEAGLECIDGTCQQPQGDGITGCFTDAYWENATSGAKIMGTNDDDLFIAGNISKSVAEGCNDIGIFIKDYTNDNTVKSGFGVPEGSSRETLSWTTEYNAASGYSRYYFIASTVGAEDGADSRSGTGAGLIKVFKQEPLEGGSCEDYDSQEVCSDDPWGIADGGSGGEGSCSWDDVTSICNQGDIVVPPGPDGQGGGTCSYSQNTTDTCEDDGHLSFQMVARWSGDDPQPEWCKDKPQNVVECPAQIALPFWGAYNVLIISLVIVFAYAAIILSKKKRLLGISLPRIRFAFI